MEITNYIDQNHNEDSISNLQYSVKMVSKTNMGP